MTRRTFGGALILATTVRATDTVLRIRVKGRIESIELEKYTSAVLTGESSVFRSDEALKAMAVAARTYAMRFRGRHNADGFDLCDTTHCQRFDPSPASARVTSAVRQTAGELIQYQGRPALTYYALDCGGHTETALRVWSEEVAVPYLRDRTDPYCLRAGKGKWHWEMGVGDLELALRDAGLITPVRLQRVTVTERSESTRAVVLTLRGVGQTEKVSASALRFAVGREFGFNTVRSDLYQVGVSGSRIVFDGVGVGHGVGLCQRGADQMGAEGHGYRDILRFYYPGTEIPGHYVPALTWRRVSGERLSLFTARPDRDGAVLALAERTLTMAKARTKIGAPRGIVIRVYPDMASYIEATGEPGWVAAHVSGREIQLQPVQVLRDRGALETTLRHELLHVLIESRARTGLPVWFREGLTDYLADATSADTAPGAVRDRDLRQTADEARARAAYEQARRNVSALVNRYGERAVLSWLTAGLPREAMNANSKQPVTNSR